MGVLIKGVWSNIPTNEKTKSGQFVRKESFFRNWITNDSSKAIKEKNSFVAEKKGMFYTSLMHVLGLTEL